MAHVSNDDRMVIGINHQMMSLDRGVIDQAGRNKGVIGVSMGVGITCNGCDSITCRDYSQEKSDRLLLCCIYP